MRRSVWTLVAAIALAWASRAVAAPQSPIIEAASPPAQEAGLSLAAAAVNIVYFPARLVLTLLTAEVGGLSAWLTGGNRQSAASIWESTDGQAFITPRVLQGRERLRFGRSLPD